MSNQDIDKKYVSPYDQFLFEFDATHPKSGSQLAEINKYQRISTLRDDAEAIDTASDIWSAF